MVDRWAEEEDILVCYLYRFPDCKEITQKNVDKQSKRTEATINMRKANFISVASGGKRGLGHPSNQTRRVYSEWKNKSQSEHKEKCKRILADSSG